VLPMYKQLKVEKYFGGYLMHPYMSWYTGRGCKSRCTFCLWPQTVGGHRYRTRSAQNVIAEVQWIKENMPEVKEVMFDDDTFTDSANLPRVEAIARGLGELGMTWSCNARANVPYNTLKIMKENGLRLLLVGYESGDDQILHNIKKGLRTEIAARFTADCHRLGILIHGTFILGLPGQTQAHIEETLQLLGQLPLAGASVSPFISGEQTPFADHPTGDFESTIQCIARLRLRNPSYIIPAISALNLVSENGYVRALRAGARSPSPICSPACGRPTAAAGSTRFGGASVRCAPPRPRTWRWGWRPTPSG